MLIRLRLLSFLITCVFAGNVYAVIDAKSPTIKQAEPAQTTSSTETIAAPVTAPAADAPEPTAFEPIVLPKPVVNEVTAKPSATKVVAKTPVCDCEKVAIATPVKIATVAAPKPVKKVATTTKPVVTPKAKVVSLAAKATPPETHAEVAAQTSISVPSLDRVPAQSATPVQEDSSAPTYINTAPVVESTKAANRQCSSNNRLQKSLLVMTFPRLIPTSSNAGELYQVEQQLPQLLSQQLINKHSAISPIQLGQTLPTADASSDAQLAMLTQRLASSHRSQFILSGEIVDMSMSTPDATYNPGFYTRTLNTFFDTIEAKNRFDKRDRLFSFKLHLRDGFTGQELLSKRYDTYGIWGYNEKVGFGSPLFWKSDYGQQIKSLVNTASKDLSEVINCQPLIAQIDSRPGQTQFILQSGTNNGLHAGDMLALYQLVTQGSETRYQEYDVRLINRNVAIELREVYASHSVGVISGSPYLTGQLLAVAP